MAPAVALRSHFSQRRDAVKLDIGHTETTQIIQRTYTSGKTTSSSTLGNFRNAKISSGQRVDPAEQIFLARHPGDLIAQLPVLEEKQGWDSADVILKGKALVFVHVDFCNLDCARFFPRNLIKEGRDHFAGAAPFRPKIDNHRLVALRDFAVEVGFVEIDGRGI